jgi:hypothetical protein
MGLNRLSVLYAVAIVANGVRVEIITHGRIRRILSSVLQAHEEPSRGAPETSLLPCLRFSL